MGYSDKMDTVGAVIESLIYIRDKQPVSVAEGQYLADACNILEHRFRNTDNVDVIINDHVTSLHLSRSEVGDKLHEKGFLGNDKNIDYLVEQGLVTAFQNRLTEMMWEIIEDVINGSKEGLEKR